MKRSFRTLYSATFQDSQSGLLLVKPQRGVLRIHEIGSSSNSTSTSPQTTRDIPLREAFALTSSIPPRLFSATVSSSADLDSILHRSNEQDKNRFSISLTARLEKANNTKTDSLLDTINLIKRATGRGFLVRAVILNAWDSGLDALENSVGRLADSGASVITVSAQDEDNTNVDDDLDEDDVREAIERVFNLDVAGDAMMERLSARLSLKSSKIAIETGITRLESQADESTKVGIAFTSELIQLAIKKGRRVVFT